MANQTELTIDLLTGGVSAFSGFVTNDSPTFTGTVTLPSTTSIGNVTSTEIGYLDGVTSNIQTQINTIQSTGTSSILGDLTLYKNNGIAGIIFEGAEPNTAQTTLIPGEPYIDFTYTLPNPTASQSTQYYSGSSNDQIVVTKHPQILTNKTLTSPILITPTINAGGVTIKSTSNSQATLIANTASGTPEITLPATSGTLATTSQQFYIGTQAIGINASSGTITSLPGVSSINGATIPTSGTLATLTGTETLTNKKIFTIQTVPTARSTGTAISAAECAGGIIELTAAVTQTLPPATDLNAVFPTNAPIGTTLEWSFTNSSTSAITIQSGDNNLIRPTTQTVAGSSGARYKTVKTATGYTTYRG